MTEFVAQTDDRVWMPHALQPRGDVSRCMCSFNIIAAGLWFYLYNELATFVVKKTGPVTQSVANTAKRVIVIVACAIVLGEVCALLLSNLCTSVFHDVKCML